MKRLPHQPQLTIIFICLLFSCLVSCVKKTPVEEEELEEMIKVYYQEPHRPQIHFSPEAAWMNDPNGMVYYEGEYHLFFQHYPDGTTWGPMHWGHAVSTDLVHWEHLPIALYPDELGYIFSGSAVVDENNTSGLAQEGEVPLVAVYTYHDTTGERAGRNDFQTQGIAYSLDKGRSWEKYEGNPVLENPGIRDFRDPKVFWHESSESWIMILAVKDRIHLYRSPNLTEWTFASEFGVDQGSHGGVWECPDLFELPVDGNANQTKWLMIVSLGDGAPNGGSGTQYFIGEFDGTTFTNDNPAEIILWMDYGRDNYAGVSWSDIPEKDGRRIFIGWMSNWSYANQVPTDPWRSAMTIARTLTLETRSEGIRLITQPVAEMEKLRTSVQSIDSQSIAEIKEVAKVLPPFELTLTFNIEKKEQGRVGVILANEENESVQIGYDVANQRFFIDRRASGNSDFAEDFPGEHVAPFPIEGGEVNIRLYVDVASIELFAQEGASVMTENVFPSELFGQLRLFADEGEAELVEGTYYPLSSIWEQSAQAM